MTADITYKRGPLPAGNYSVYEESQVVRGPGLFGCRDADVNRQVHGGKPGCDALSSKIGAS